MATVCKKCPNHGSRRCPISSSPHVDKCWPGEGPKPSSLVFVGEAPGPTEYEKERFFVGRAGQELDSQLDLAGVQRSEIFITNVCKFFPRFLDKVTRNWKVRKPTDQEVAACMAYLKVEMARVQPKVIVAVGGTALTALLGHGERITKEVGKILTSTIFPGVKIIPIIHPSYFLRRGGSEGDGALLYQRRQNVTAIKLALKESKGGSRRAFATVVLDTLPKLKKAYGKVKRHARVLSVDTESSGRSKEEALDWTTSLFLCTSLAYRPDRAYVVPWAHGPYTRRKVLWSRDDQPRVQKYLKKMVELPIPKIASHASHDAKQLRSVHGIELMPVVADPIQAEHILDPNALKDLKTLGSLYTDLEPWDEKLEEYKNSTGVTDYGEIPQDILYPYAGGDVCAPLIIAAEQERRLKKLGAWDTYRKIILPWVRELFEGTYEGLVIDKDRLLQVSQEFSVKMSELERRIWKRAGVEFNLNSRPQTSDVLFKRMGFSAPDDSTGKSGVVSTAAWVIDTLRQDETNPKRLKFLDDLTEYYELYKLKSTYLDGSDGSGGLLSFVRSTGCIHATENTSRVETTRASYVRPPVQTFPKRKRYAKLIRNLVVPKPGHVLIHPDYETLEPKVQAVLANCKKLLAVFTEGKDIYSLTYSIIYNIKYQEVTPKQRDEMKPVFLAIMYRESAESLAAQAGVTLKKAKWVLRRVATEFHEIREYQSKAIAFVAQHGYIQNPFGLRRKFPEAKALYAAVQALGSRMDGYARSLRSKWAAIERELCNWLIQSSGHLVLARAIAISGPVIRKQGGTVLLDDHDGALISVPKSCLDVCCGAYELAATRKVKELRGFSFNVKTPVYFSRWAAAATPNEIAKCPPHIQPDGKGVLIWRKPVRTPVRSSSVRRNSSPLRTPVLSA